MYDFFIAPFEQYVFLQRALIACIVLAIGSAPVGVFIVLRRMSLMGDALSHSILPGVAIGFLISGSLCISAMSLGGFISALTVALLAGFVSRKTVIQEDASLVGFYLISLAFGSIVISKNGTNVDLMHILFGTILSVDTASLILMTVISVINIATIAIIYRALIVECFDPAYMQSIFGHGAIYHSIFIVLIVLSMVSSFQALGTLMALGVMMLPAIAARFWTCEIGKMFIYSAVISIFSGYIGLLLSYHYVLPSGPSIIIVAGSVYVFSIIFGKNGSLMKRALT